jgi:hypothetical protein
MTRDYGNRGLSPTDDLLHRMILDNTHVTRETRDMVMRGVVQTTELRHDLMHLSKQAVGLTFRVWQLEEGMRQIKALPPKAQEASLWAETLGLFTKRQRIILMLLSLAVLLGLLEPVELKTAIMGFLGLK